MSGADEELREEMRRLAARFGHSEAALYPFLNREVPTPEGPGELVQVLGGRCRVVVGGRLVRVPWDDVEVEWWTAISCHRGAGWNCCARG